jgi:hypothetical protein
MLLARASIWLLLWQKGRKAIMYIGEISNRIRNQKGNDQALDC